MTDDRDRTARERLTAAAESTQQWLRENEAVFVCDFCAHPIKGDFATYTLRSPIVASMSVLDSALGTATVGFVDSEDWAACLKCDPVIAAGDAAALAAYVSANRNTARVPGEVDAFYLSYLVELYEQFYARNPTRTEAHR